MWTETHWENNMLQIKAENRVMPKSNKPKNTKGWQQSGGRRVNKGFSYSFRKEQGPANTLTLDFYPPTLRDNNFVIFNHQVCGTLLQTT